MIKIKEGQIYQRPNGVKLLITSSTPVSEKILNEKVEGFYCYITPIGYTSRIADCVVIGFKLVAEYKTWREAATSKDFLPMEV